MRQGTHRESVCSDPGGFQREWLFCSKTSNRQQKVVDSFLPIEMNLTRLRKVPFVERALSHLYFVMSEDQEEAGARPTGPNSVDKQNSIFQSRKGEIKMSW